MSNLLKAIQLDMINLTFQLHHQSVLFTRGNRPEPQPISFDSTQPQTIEINWLNNANQPSHEDDTLCVMFAESINGQELTTVMQTNVTRSSETATIQLLPKYQGEDLHLWISFISATENEASNSTYLGQLTIA